MEVTQQLTWPVATWPGSASASQYTVFRIYPDATPTAVQNVTTNSAAIAYDDTANTIFQIRPSSGNLPTLSAVGPVVMTYVIGYVPCRAWLRQKIRIQLADRADANTGADLLWPDDELNADIIEAFGEINLLFPVEGDTQIALLPPTVDGSGNAIG